MFLKTEERGVLRQKQVKVRKESVLCRVLFCLYWFHKVFMIFDEGKAIKQKIPVAEAHQLISKFGVCMVTPTCRDFNS